MSGLMKLLGLALSKGRVTLSYQAGKAATPEGLRGRPVLDPEKCIGCSLCARVCPAFAIELIGGPGPKCEGLKVDLGKCLFCQQCEEVCPRGAIRLTQEYELAVLNKESGVIVFRKPLAKLEEKKE